MHLRTDLMTYQPLEEAVGGVSNLSKVYNLVRQGVYYAIQSILLNSQPSTSNISPSKTVSAPGFHPPNTDDSGDYLFIIVDGINHMAEWGIVETAQLSVTSFNLALSHQAILRRRREVTYAAVDLSD
jgi:hypothetical protein